MAKLSVDGVEYQVAEGRTILQALDDLGLLMNGVDVPHYCWHPKLSIDGSCRLCQVEIDGMPKLQIACNTPVRDGMVVKTTTPRVADARRGVMELLLLNHPLDCPICDQAGECKLQDYAFDYGVEHARTDDPRRPAKKATPLGPTITFDQERCILCRRCVRFCREVSETGELGVFQRGEESLLELFPGSQLDNPYSMNVADICPVGALTTTDFRFKIRVWFLDDVPSVCNQCSNGCNIQASRSNNKVYRYVPRRNDAVNDTWMCDHGRMSYKALAEGRLEQATVRRKVVDYDAALRAAGEALRDAQRDGGRVVGVASPFVANEDLFVFRRFLAQLGAEPATFRVPKGPADDLLIKAEKAPNAAGARLGFRESDKPVGTAALAIVLGHETPPEALAGAAKILLIDTHASELAQRADVVLPARTFAEREGSFTNHARRAQAFRAILEPRFEAWSEGEILHQIAAAAGMLGWDKLYDVRRTSRELAAAVPAFAAASLDQLGDAGAELSPDMNGPVIFPVLFIFSMLALVFAPIMTWVERKQSALMQDRIGANRANIFGFKAIGLMHPLADAIKMFTKEDFVPAGASRLLHTISPFIATVPAMISFAVIPYGGSYEAWGVKWQLVGADLDFGILYVFAVGSIATYGSVLGGWASNNNWGMLGSLRVSAQMLSYEVAMGIPVVGLFMIFGTLWLTEMGLAQQETFRLLGFLEHFGVVSPGNFLVDFLTLPKWGIFLQPLSFFIFLAAALAENKRPPFDTPEGEAEIIAGYFIEYSGMKFGLYTMGELVEVVVIAGLLTAMFLGGWALPWVTDRGLISGLTTLVGPNLGNVLAMLIHVGTFFAKLILMIMLLMQIRWTMPRFRYDQVMDLGWKIMLPLSLGNIVLTGFVVLLVGEITK